MAVQGVGYTPGSGTNFAVTPTGDGPVAQWVLLGTGDETTVTPVGSGNRLPVELATCPLPSDAATETTLSAIAGLLAGTLTVGVSGSVAVTGTFWQATQPVSAAALPLPSNAAAETGGNLAATATSLAVMDDWDESDRAKVNPIVGQAGVAGNSGNVGATVQRVVIATDQPQLTNKLLVTPDANSAVNIAQMNGVTVTMGTGNSGTGVQRVVLATDQPQLTNKLLVTPDANSAVNVAQMNGIAVSMGSGASGTGVQRVILATNDPAVVQLTAGATAIAKAEDVATAGGDVGVPAMAVQTATPADTAADNDYVFHQMKGGRLWVSGPGFITCKTSVTRPNDTTGYSINDAVANSTSAPTSGGFTLTSAGRFSGGTGIITDLMVVYSTQPATPPQFEIWIFDTSVTAVNDNAAFTITDAEALTCMAIVPVTCNIPGGSNNYIGIATGLNIGFTCSGSANLRYLMKAKVAWTPAAQDVISVCAKIQYAD